MRDWDCWGGVVWEELWGRLGRNGGGSGMLVGDFEEEVWFGFGVSW